MTKTAATSARTSGSGAPRKVAKPLGWVSFVGSGPGDHDLLTVRAVALIRAADVVVTEVPGHADLVRALVGDAPCPELVDGGFGDDGDELWVRAVALSPDGSLSVRRSATGSTGDPVAVGRALAAEMLAEGAVQLIDPNEAPATETASERL